MLAQLGNRVQHALRAYTPDDAKALRQAAATYPRTAYDLEELLTSLGIGEAVVTVLSERGTPTPVAWTRMKAPNSLMDPSPPETVAAVLAASPVAGKYAAVLDRESAYELLARRLRTAPPPEPEPSREPSAAPETAPEAAPERPARVAEESGMLEKVATSPAFRSMLRSAGTVIGREITRSIFGTSRRRRR